MTNTVQIIEALEATTKRNEKEQILTAAFMDGERDFFTAAKLAYDILVTFGVKKVAEIDPEAEDVGGDYSFVDFLSLAAKLRARELTGHAARDAIHEAANRSNVKTWNTFYRRILLKDFKCGVDTSTINKVLKAIAKSTHLAEASDFIIPVFSCQLAKDGADPDNAKHVTGRKMLDIKLDGVRLLTVLDKEQGTITQYTRNGKVNENFTEIRESLQAMMDYLPGSVVIDGEVVAKSFQDLMRHVNRRTDVDTSAARLAVFDMIPLEDFRAGICTTPQEIRHTVLADLDAEGLFKKFTNGIVYVIPKVTVDLDTVEGQKTYAEFNKAAIEAGYEGVMLKDPDAPYETRRTKAWLKVKPFIEVSLTVVGVEVGKEDGKRKGLLGAIVCEGYDDGKFIKSNVGSGFTDAQVKEYWEDQSLVMGMVVEIRADCLTQDEDSTGTNNYSLRFPRFKGFRGTVPGEKL
jgi:DNA ligase-1